MIKRSSAVPARFIRSDQAFIKLALLKGPKWGQLSFVQNRLRAAQDAGITGLDLLAQLTLIRCRRLRSSRLSVEALKFLRENLHQRDALFGLELQMQAGQPPGKTLHLRS